VLGQRALGNRSIILDKLTYAADQSHIEPLGQDVLAIGDITDRRFVKHLLAEYRPSALVHFAAESHVDRSIEDPSAFISTNIVGTYELLEVVHESMHHLPEHFLFLHVSTDEVYGSLGPLGHFSEASPYAPSSPYAASKAASDHLVRAYHKTYGLSTVVTHCSNNYGPRQFPEKLIPVIIHRALEGKPIPVYGDGSNVRDWLHVSDHCAALRLVLDRGVDGQTYDIGGGKEISNLQLAHRLCAILDEEAPGPRPYADQITMVADRLGHDHRYAIDSSKIRLQLGWRPTIDFEQGLRSTVQWYLQRRKEAP
jgi:dTDP-glucose 4,6-dehydratase